MTFKNRRVLFFGFFYGVLFCSYSSTGLGQTNPYKQIRIPLNSQNGVPFSKDPEGREYYIEGFDVDSNENFYFLGGKETTLACFSKDGKNIYRRFFPHLVPGQMHIWDKKIYFFEIGAKNLNTIVEIDKSSGLFVREYPRTITKALKSYGYKQIDSYEFDKFRDSILHITYIDSEGIDKTKTICFTLKGELIPNCAQHVANSPAIESDDRFEHLGKWGDNYVLGRFDDNENNKYDLSLRNSSNAEISKSFVDLRYLGKPMCGTYCMPQEHRKVRNNTLYMLNRDKNMAVITEIDLATLFHIR